MKAILPWLVAGLFAVLLVVVMVRARTAAAEAEKAAEAAELKLKGFQVAVQVKDKALEIRANEIGSLQGELQRLRKESPGVKVKTVIRWKTVYLPAGGDPRPPDAPGAPPLVCVLAQGDQGQIRVDAVRAETKAGNVVAVGNAEAWRVQPEPATLLFGGPFEASLSSVVEAEVKPQANWALGASGWWRNPSWTAEVRGGYRLSGPLWIDAAARFDNQYSAGVRWEFR